MSVVFEPSKVRFLPSQAKAMCCGRLATGTDVDEDVYDRVRDGLGHGTIPHKNFYAYCWFQEGQWHAEVWQKGFHAATWSDPVLVNIIRDLTMRYGTI